MNGNLDQEENLPNNEESASDGEDLTDTDSELGRNSDNDDHFYGDPTPRLDTIQDVATWLPEQDLSDIKILDQGINALNGMGPCNGYRDQLLDYIKKHRETQNQFYIYRGFVTYVLLSAFKTAETIIQRLADTPTRKLNRRFKYAWTQLKHRKDGTVSHNFVHNVGSVPSEYIKQVENEAPSYQKNLVAEAPYFLADEMAKKDASIENMVISETIQEDQKLSDIYHPTDYDMSPCSIHDGTKLRTDCVICKRELLSEDMPVVISRAFMKKINVTENLLKFLAIQQDKRAAEQNQTSRTQPKNRV